MTWYKKVLLSIQNLKVSIKIAKTCGICLWTGVHVKISKKYIKIGKHFYKNLVTVFKPVKKIWPTVELLLKS